jgi:hypothetical protein
VAVALVVTWLLHTAAVAAWWLPPLAAVVVIWVLQLAGLSRLRVAWTETGRWP